MSSEKKKKKKGEPIDSQQQLGSVAQQAALQQSPALQYPNHNRPRQQRGVVCQPVNCPPSTAPAALSLDDPLGVTVYRHKAIPVRRCLAQGCYIISGVDGGGYCQRHRQTLNNQQENKKRKDHPKVNQAKKQYITCESFSCTNEAFRGGFCVGHSVMARDQSKSLHTRQQVFLPSASMGVAGTAASFATFSASTHAASMTSYGTRVPATKHRHLSRPNSTSNIHHLFGVDAPTTATTSSFSNAASFPTNGPTDTAPSDLVKKKKRRIVRSEEDVKAQYEDRNCIRVALARLRDANNNVDNATGLTIIRCCAVLWVCFGKFHRNNLKAPQAKKMLIDAIAANARFSAAEYLDSLESSTEASYPGPDVIKNSHSNNGYYPGSATVPEPDEVKSGPPKFGGTTRASQESDSEPEPDETGSGATLDDPTNETVKRKRIFIQHCNEDVYARLGKSRRHGVGTFALKDFSEGTKLFKTIPGVQESDTVVLTRMEIESQILNDEVKRLIYDMFEPMKDRTDHMRDAFSLPAKGLNDLPSHNYMNAAASRTNVRANAERDRQGYVTAEASRDGRKGEELLWHSHTRDIKSAGDYDFYAAESRPAAYNINHEHESRSAEVDAAKAREIERLRSENAKLMYFVNRTWRPLSADGGDVGKYGMAYFEADRCWMEVHIKSFTSGRERANQPSRGSYSFEFNIKDEEGKPQTEDGMVLDSWDSDNVSVGDPSVRVQDGWGV